RADLMTIRKLARQFSKEFLFDILIAEMAETEAAGVLAAFLHHPNTSAQQRKRMKSEWNAIPSSASLFDESGKGERYYPLDAICFAARNGDDRIPDLSVELLS